MNINDISFNIPSTITSDSQLFMLVNDEVGTSYYYNGYGWFGDITTLDLTSGYYFRNELNNSIIINLTGLIQPTVDISLKLNWNMISYPSSIERYINEVIIGSENDLITDTNNPAAYYYNGFGWFDPGFTLMPGVGYYYNSTNVKTITINNE